MSKNNENAHEQPGEKPARATKINIVLAALRRPEGADVDTISAATGWQAHSVRGAIAGHIKKKLGLKVETSKVGGKTIYRLGDQT